jgi:hypothetical protein
MSKLKTIVTTLLVSTSMLGFAQEADEAKNWTIKGENTLLINQSSFSNWAAGGINSFAGNLVLNYDFNYAKDKWSWDNKAIAAYGKTFQDATKWRKNDDRLILNSLLGYKAAEKWLYTFYGNFNTQFSDGFNYDGDNNETLISKAFAPAYLSFGPGIAYKESDNFRINLSPAAARLVIVGEESLREAYGVDLDQAVRTEFGASLDAYYKVNLMENISFENILKLYSNYLEDPQNVDVDYTANLFLKVNDYITVNTGVQLLYDDNVQIQKTDVRVGPGLQVRQVFGAGFTYKF